MKHPPDPRVIRRGDHLAMGPLLMSVASTTRRTITLVCGNAGGDALRSLMGAKPRLWGATWTVTDAEGDSLILALAGPHTLEPAGHSWRDGMMVK